MAKERKRGAGGGDEDGPGFEEALREVEAIIARIESGEVGLEKSISEYERGAALIQRCRQILGVAEQRVEDLTSRMRGGAGSSADEAPKGSRGVSRGTSRGPDPDGEAPF